MRIGMFLLLAFALALGTGLGCYTMVRHPAIGVAPDEIGEPGCNGCHAATEYHLWADPYYTSYYRYYPPTWGPYYAHPWWYDGYWWHPPGADGPPIPIETGGRHAWDRGPGAPYVPPGGGTTVVAPPSPRQPATAPADSSGGKETKPQREGKPKSDPKRNAWGR